MRRIRPKTTERNAAVLVCNLTSMKCVVERTEKLPINASDTMKRAQAFVVDGHKAAITNFDKEHPDDEPSFPEVLPEEIM